MDTMHKHAHGPHEGRHPQGHGHGHSDAHRHGSTQAGTPHTEGRLIRRPRIYDVRVALMLLGQARKLRALPLDLAALRPGERVLDVGCGSGDLALAAARRVGSRGAVYGIDAAPEMVALAARKVRRSGRTVRFEVQPVEAMSFPDASFDVVLSSLMIHHLPGDLKARAVAEIRRVLRPGGRLVVVDLQALTRAPHPWEPGWMITKLHKQQPNPDAVLGLPAVADLLRSSGFERIESASTRYAWLGYATAAKPE